MSGEPPLAYAELVAEVRRLCAGRHSGTLFIATANNHSGRIGFSAGKIVAVRFRLLTGVDALGEISRIEAARWRFTDQAPETTDALPDTADLLMLLSGPDGDTTASTAPPAGEDFVHAEQVLSPALAEFLGPMARVVVREHLNAARQYGDDLRTIVEGLAREIPDRDKAALFVERVLAKLGE
jgi:hypothetical protein